MDVVKLLSDKKITGVPVVDNGALVGVVSEKDTFKLILHGAFTQVPTGQVKEIMSTNVETVKPEDDVFFIAQKFFDRNYRRLPVVDGDKVLGIISRRDILECIRKMGH
jgi:CBS domain-containing protein